jgi:16S rRNA (guanine527-N7)-methyltransferase
MIAEISRALTSLRVGERERALLERFVAAFLERNAAMNLSAARDAAAVAAHIADSLAIVDLIREPLVDVGSGGGFPAVPLAIVTGFRTTLIEATGKKARFLAEIVEELGLPIDVCAARAEDAARDAALRGAFGSATARAVSSTPTVLELTVPFLRLGGVAVLQRGKLAERERTAATDAALVLGAELVEERSTDVPPVDRPGDSRHLGEPGFDERESTERDERRVLVFRKVAATGQRFPRRAGIPSKRPLCFEGASDG